VKALYITDRRAIGQQRFESLLVALRGAEELSVQLREAEESDRETVALARRTRELLGPEVPLYLNRRFDLALAAEASGVHLPAAGLPARRVRANTPRGLRIGVSTHSAQEASAAIEEGADLVVIGPIFDTPSKRAFGPPLGPEELSKLPEATEHSAEIYAIGGIDQSRLGALLPYRDRIAGVAAIRMFQEASDPRAVEDTIWRL
jgi:thiamine-phosphate pyrophosphorylase